MQSSTPSRIESLVIFDGKALALCDPGEPSGSAGVDGASLAALIALLAQQIG